MHSPPPLVDKGAYAAAAKYQPEEVVAIVQYGYERGVRVLPEFDMPGHAYSWGFGDPDVVSMCPSSLAANINNFPLDPSQQHTFEVVNDFLADMFQLFTDEYVHLGGDEVVYSCWSVGISNALVCVPKALLLRPSVRCDVHMSPCVACILSSA
jgi:hexosaminidase